VRRQTQLKANIDCLNSFYVQNQAKVVISWEGNMFTRCFTALFLTAVTTFPTFALECIPFDKPGNTQNFQWVPTRNGAMFVAYAVANTPLHLDKIKLKNGKTVKGAVPGPVPLVFAWRDKLDTLRVLNSLSLTYVTKTQAGDRTLQTWDRDHQPIATTQIPGEPLLTLNTLSSSPTDATKKFLQMDVMLSDYMVTQFCVDPGDRVDIKSDQFEKQFRAKPLSK
jgi:hypothetical protein